MNKQSSQLSLTQNIAVQAASHRGALVETALFASRISTAILEVSIPKEILFGLIIPLVSAQMHLSTCSATIKLDW